MIRARVHRTNLHDPDDRWKFVVFDQTPGTTDGPALRIGYRPTWADALTDAQAWLFVYAHNARATTLRGQ